MDLILILAASFFYFASPMLVTPLITGFAESVGASAALMGMIGGLMNLCALFCRPIAGNLADKISKYKLSFLGAGLMALSCLGYMAALEPLLIAISRVVNGIGFACCSVCMSTWMSHMLPKEKIGSGMGFYGMMNAMAMAVAPAIGVVSYQHLGYRFSFGVALFFCLATLLIIQFIQNKCEPEQSLKEPGRSGKLQLADPKVLPYAAIIMLFAIPYCATQSFLVSYTHTRQLPVSVTLFFPLYAVLLLILRLCMKDLFDRLPFSFFLLFSSVSAFAGILFLAFMQNNFFMFFAAADGYAAFFFLYVHAEPIFCKSSEFVSVPQPKLDALRHLFRCSQRIQRFLFLLAGIIQVIAIILHGLFQLAGRNVRETTFQPAHKFLSVHLCSYLRALARVQNQENDSSFVMIRYKTAD